jgi:hypothetical protein
MIAAKALAGPGETAPNALLIDGTSENRFSTQRNNPVDTIQATAKETGNMTHHTIGSGWSGGIARVNAKQSAFSVKPWIR